MKLKIVVVTAVVLALVIIGCEMTAQTPANYAGENESVKQENKEAASVQIEPEPADNSFCYVCHGNFVGEEISLNHESAGVGCTTCHGPSGGHSSDEDGLKPPDIMFAKEKIDSACKKCHTTATAHPPKHCTDCHGDHVMASRTRRWDKNTGELIWDDGVRTDLQTIYGEDKPLVD